MTMVVREGGKGLGGLGAAGAGLGGAVAVEGPGTGGFERGGEGGVLASGGGLASGDAPAA